MDPISLQSRLQPAALAALDLTTGLRWTYAEFDADVGRYAALLARRGIRSGDRVASLAKNRAELILLHLACARLGAMYVPLNWRLAAAEIADLLRDSEPGLLVGDESLLRTQGGGVTIDEFAAAAHAEHPSPPGTGDASQPSLILYTSGTSGRPKGVLLSEHNLWQTGINFSVFGRVTHASVVLCDAPMFHIIGLVTNIRPTLMRGGAILVSDGFVPGRTLERLSDPTLGVTHYFCVPQMAALLRAHPSFDPATLRGLTALFSGGAPHAADAIRAWCNDGIPIADGFGMSEAGTVSCMPLDAALIAARAGSAGLVPFGMAAEIRSPDGTPCATGVAGELFIQGPSISRGYWRRAEATRDAFDEAGWFRSGDIARFDADGYLWLVDRKKDMFISGGENVYPAEIENALAGLPGMVECAVVGVADAQWGEVGHLVVVAAPGSCLELPTVNAFLEARIARYKLPKQFTCVAALPRNGAGKIDKAALRAMLKRP